MIIYVDMDGTLCDFSGPFNDQKSDIIPYPQAIPGFFRNLEPLHGAIQGYKNLHLYGQVYILTRPSYLNPLCYTEKRLWVEENLGIEYVDKLILCGHKNLLKGDYLIDDCASGAGQENFEGKLIHFGSKEFNSWSYVESYFKQKFI